MRLAGARPMSLMTELGFKANDLLAGFLGGVTALFVNKTTKPFEAIGLVVSGALTANFLTEPAARMIGLNAGATGFILGLCAMAVANAIMSAARNWRPRAPGDSPPAGGGQA